MKLFKLISVILVTVGLAFSQNTFRIAADSSSGTYAASIQELVEKCNGLDIQLLVGHPSGANGGAVGNLSALYYNKADAAVLHSDVYLFNAQSDPTYNRFKTLVPLWPEPIHVIVLATSKSKKHGFAFGTMTFNTLSDLFGYTVGAAGGGVLTSKLLTDQGGGKFTVSEFSNGKAVLDALDNGTVDAAIFVGAAPLPNLLAIGGSGRYRLIPVGDAIASHVGSIYRPVKIPTYPGLSSGPIPTLAPLATLFSRQFLTPGKINAQKQFRACLANKLGELQDSGSTIWQDVKAGDQGISTIPYLDVK
jgi:TRAP-type uncharacterized transport system substrate-binding protein